MKNEQEALRALRAGDFATAARLLKTVVEENQYSSASINNAYTIALHRTGNNTELAEASFHIGNLFVDKDPAAAMDYFQRAMLASYNRERIRKIGEVYEAWAAPRSHSSANEPVRTDRVAHVIGCLLPGHAPSLYVQILSKALKAKGVESSVFTTEWAASWFFNPPGVRQSQPIDIDAETIIASVEGDFMERAERIAAAIRNANIDVAFYHSGLTEQITARVAALRPARIQVNVNHANEMDADLFDGFVHLFQNGVARSRFPFRPWRWIPLISDIEDRLAACQPMSRQALGLDSTETVTGTFGNLYKVSEPEYLQALTDILKRFPKNFHLFAGAGDDSRIKAFLDKAGVTSRVQFLGHVPDVAPLLDVIDVYLNSFPESGGQSVLEPMAAAKPAVIRRFDVTSHFNVGEELAGLPDLIAGSDAEYVEIADRLLRDASLRDRYGELLRQRFRAEFTPARLAEKYLDFLGEVIAVTGGENPPS